MKSEQLQNARFVRHSKNIISAFIIVTCCISASCNKQRGWDSSTHSDVNSSKESEQKKEVGSRKSEIPPFKAAPEYTPKPSSLPSDPEGWYLTEFDKDVEWGVWFAEGGVSKVTVGRLNMKGTWKRTGKMVVVDYTDIDRSSKNYRFEIHSDNSIVDVDHGSVLKSAPRPPRYK